jgi:hypothetical protein
MDQREKTGTDCMIRSFIICIPITVIIIENRYDSLAGGSALQQGQHEHRRDGEDIHFSSGIRAGEDILSLRLRGHCDRQFAVIVKQY